MNDNIKNGIVAGIAIIFMLIVLIYFGPATPAKSFIHDIVSWILKIFNSIFQVLD